MILGSIAVLCVGVQVFFAVSELLLGNLDRFLVFSVNTVGYWLLFYFLWIGIHWLRWVWGVWNLGFGFCWLIWALRDMSGPEALGGTMCLLIGALLLSPAVYFFTREQRTKLCWSEVVLAGTACLLVLGSIIASLFGLWSVRNERLRDAIDFAQIASDRIYIEHDREWLLAHVTQQSLRNFGHLRMDNFFRDTERLGHVEQISGFDGEIRLHYCFPFRFDAGAHIIGRAHSEDGPIEAHLLLLSSEKDWQIDRIWWRPAPLQ